MLHIEHLTKRYGGRAAVDDLTLHIAPGEIFGFIGHNGAGKTTTLKSAAGILPFDEGRVTVDGISMRDDPLACKRRMAYLPDNPDLYEFMSAVKYLHFIADIYGVGAERGARIAEMAEAFSLTEHLAQPISALSHGMKQKVAIISAFLHTPRLILLDEPFVGLDPRAAHILKEMMRRHCEAGGAILFSTHVLDTAERLCDKIAIIKGGRLLTVGSTVEVRGDASLEEVFLELAEDEEDE
ncbi:MAG: ABC transporter ATP-binding protein [Clostridia bacterium]|nr:ABC transporter ATP-binding protein [Clostridia bacterium]